MKRLVLFVLLAAFFGSCKKDKAPADTISAFKKNLISVSAPGQSEWTMFYANDRKLLSFSNNEMSVSYKPGIPFSAKKTALGSVSEYKNAVQDAQGRVTKLERYKSGALISKQEFKYNAEGYLIEQTISQTSSNTFEKSVYDYQNGNLTSISLYIGGIKMGSFVFDYYTNLSNPIQFDLFDFKRIEFVTDAQFGKQSKNLLKNVKLYDGSGQHFVELNLSYATDAEGYIKTMIYSLNGQGIITYTFSFQ